MVQEFQLESMVTLTGSQSNPYSVMRGRSLYVCSSQYEGYNLAIAEAMVLGLPVVSTRCAGPIEILQDGNYGHLCENSEEGIYQAIKGFLLCPDQREQYARLSLERQSVFQKEAIMKQIDQLL
jgi:glycosyltransferase involved in cell wall biosynthesis